MIRVALTNETDFVVPRQPLDSVVTQIVSDHGYSRADISLAVVDDPTIHRLNRQHLQHDFPTDVLSFVLDDDGCLEGEVIVSADTAIASAAEYRWDAASELLLYFIHGSLHLVGYDDQSDDQRTRMRDREAYYLRSIAIEPPAGHDIAGKRDQESVE